MVDTFDNSLMSMFAGGGDDGSASEPDLNPVTGQPNVIPRNNPEPPDRRRRTKRGRRRR